MLHRLTISSASQATPATGLARRAAPLGNQKTSVRRIGPHNAGGTRCNQPSSLEGKRSTFTGRKRCVCPCEGCGYSTTTIAELKKHWRAHSGCSLTRSSGLTSHWRGAHRHEAPFPSGHDGCRPLCTQPALPAKRLRIHSKAQPLVCTHEGCGRSFTQPGLTRHLHIHSGKKPFICPWEGCGGTFGRSSNLKAHLRIHSGEKPFICPHEGCGRPFTRLITLTCHLRCHTGEKPLVCSQQGCEHAFAQSSALRYHLRAAHTRERPFVCPHEGCEHAFIQSSHLNKHLYVHTRGKPFVCPYEDCGRSFTQSAPLRNHLRVHIRKKRFVCPHEGCGCAFILSGALKHHGLSVHAQGKIFACPHEHCTKLFNRLSNTRRHLETHRGETLRHGSLDASKKQRRNKRGLVAGRHSHNAEPAGSDTGKNNKVPFRAPYARTRDLPVHATTSARHKGRKSLRLVHNNAPQEALFAQPGHSPRPGPVPPSGPPQAISLPAAAGGGSRYLHTDLRNAALQTGPDDSAAPSGGTASENQKSHYRSVIAWISGGIVYQSPPPAQQHPG